MDIPQDRDQYESDNIDLQELRQRLSYLEDAQESKELNHEWQLRGLLIAEIRQRLRMRSLAVWIAILMLVFMSIVFGHIAHKYFARWPWSFHPTVAVAVFVAPIVSMTTLAVVLIVGAFRRFKEDEISKVSVASLTSEAVKSQIS